MTQYGSGEESDRLADENGRRVTQKRDAKNNHPERQQVIVDGGDAYPSLSRVRVIRRIRRLAILADKWRGGEHGNCADRKAFDLDREF